MADAFAITEEGMKAADQYIGQLLGQAQGDKDFAIKQLAREHDLALGTDNVARAQFLEKVASQLESRIGTIPYDYEVGTARTAEDLARTTDVANTQQKTALDRLSEDERIWKQEKAVSDKEATTNQQEGLLKRGILSGTREGAQGLAGSEVSKMDTDLQSKLDAYNRALGRTTSDIKTETANTLFTANREAGRTQEDLTTKARRGATAAEDTFQFGSEAAQRKLDAQKAELERLKVKEQNYAKMSGAAYL